MRNSALEYVESTQRRKELAEFRTGDTVRVNWKVKEGDKEREQAFEGVVIRKKKGGVSASFTVRKVSYGVGVERIFPLHSPRYSTIDVLTHGDVRRNRLFYLRALRGKASKVAEQEEVEAVAAAPAAEGGEAKPAKAPKAKAEKKPKAEKGPKAEKA
ncbi:MAG: 50S ribosomal protein L19 [Myxococcaceae bacterium]|nr:50S ribosomal protein L19 [Myxococcaceae bacterium]